MGKIKVDGNKLIECGEEIMMLSNNYINLINNLFLKLSKIQNTAWVGNSSQVYVARINFEKKQYVDFGKSLKLYGEVIRNTGNNFNNIVRKWNDK